MYLLMHRVGKFCKGLYVMGLFDNTLLSFFKQSIPKGPHPQSASVYLHAIPKTELAVAPGGCF